MRVEIQAQAKIKPSINVDLVSKLDNYDMLEMFGMIEKLEDGQCKLAKDIVILKGDEDTVFVDKPKVFPLPELFTEHAFKPEELRQSFKRKEEDFKHLRVFLPFFRYENGRLSQKQENWYKFKAWRYDIDDVDYTLEQVLELVNKLPLKTNIIHKSNKGWHLFYVFDEFIERSEVKAYNRYNDKYYLPYIVHEILTNLLPYYLKDLEPKLDVKASRQEYSLATRFIRDKLPAYVLSREYSLETFYNAYSFLIKKKFEWENTNPNQLLETNTKSPFTISDIPKAEFYNAITRCGALKSVMNDWENHNYDEWFQMATIYAISYLYAENDEERNKIEQEFYENSSKYPAYNPNRAEYFFTHSVKTIKEKGIKLYGCRKINETFQSKHTEACKSCRYKKVDKEGNIYGHYLFSYLNKENLEDEDIKVDGFTLLGDGWYKYFAETGEYVYVLPFFKITAHYIIKIGKVVNEYIVLVDKKGKSYIKLVERRKDTYKPSIDLVSEFGAINTDRVEDGKKCLARYIEKAKEKRGRKFEYIGYKRIGNDWDIVVGGYGNYTREEVSFVFYGEEVENSDWYIPEVKGSEEYFKTIYYNLFNLDDAPLHLTIAHFLSWIGREFIKSRGLISEINPILILIGDTGTGKSIRAKLATALYGKPNLFSFTNITQAGFSNRFPLIKTPFGIDEVIMKTTIDEAKFAGLVYNITNIQGKMTNKDTYNPINSPVVFTGETQNLLVYNAFSKFPGLNRRSIVIEMTDNWKRNSNVLDDALEELKSHHGHILGYIKSLKEEDKAEIEKLIKQIEAKLNFGDNNFKDLRKHLALSLAMFYHFYKHYIRISEEEIIGKVNAVIEFVAEQINKKQVTMIGENVDLTEEVINFIARVEEAINEKKSIKGASYEKLCSKIGYTPSKKVGDLLKKFFWKRYRSGGGTNLRFTPGVLIINPLFLTDDEKFYIIQADKDRLKDLKDEELKIWADVLQIRYTAEVVKKIVDALENERLRQAINLDNVKEKEEPEVDF